MSSMKERFPIFRHHPDLIYLDTAATAHKPQEVIDALSEFYAKDYGTVHRAVYRSAMEATEKYNRARASLQRFLNAAHVEEIVFTRGATDALNLVARSFGEAVLRPGDEILLSETEHHSNLVPWQMLAQRKGVSLRYIPVDDQGILQWKEMISPRTKIVALAHISNVTGTIYPIREIAASAHEKGAYLVVDGAQAAPHTLIDVQLLDCDFYAFSGHKCYGPTGIGILYGKRALLEKMAPIVGGGDMVERVDLYTATYQSPPLRFEAGTPILGSVIGLAAAIGFMEEVGRDHLTSHGSFLLERATAHLLTIPSLQILGTAPEKGPLITFHVEGVHPLDLATLLDLKQIAIRTGHLCAQPALRRFGLDTAARASFGIYNTVEDVDRFGDALKQAVRSLRGISV